MPNPIIPWPGGKRRLLKHLYPHFPAHECYVEAFAGGAAALLLRPNPAPVEVLNDINSELVNLYRCVRHNLLRIEEELSGVHVRLANVIIEQGAWREVVERYDRPHTLHYLDPPYWETEGYGVDFPWGEYEAIAAFMRQAKGKVILSINDHPEIRALFAGMNIIPLQLQYTIAREKANSTAAGELIIKSWSDAQAQLL